jgi:hypothetical protein
MSMPRAGVRAVGVVLDPPVGDEDPTNPTWSSTPATQRYIVTQSSLDDPDF